MNEADAGMQRVDRRRETHSSAVDDDLTAVRLQHASKNVHERRLTCAVFSQQSTDFTGINCKIHTLQNFICAEGFADLFHFYLHTGHSPNALIRQTHRGIKGLWLKSHSP